MTTTTATLVALTATVLKAAGTAAGQRVFTPGDWPTWDQQYPVLLVRSSEEHKRALGKAAIEFDVTATIQVIARLDAPAAAEDGGATAAEAALWVLQRQIETALINQYQIMPLLNYYPFVRSRVGASSDGEKHLAELLMEIGMEFYQGPEDFWQPANPDLDEVRIATQLPDPASPGGHLAGPIVDIVIT